MNSITDHLGRKFPIRRYNRIVSLVPSITETLFELGLGSSIVGVTRYCIYPEHARNAPRTQIGGTKTINIKKIIKLEPDLIIGNKEENRKTEIERLEEKLSESVFITYPRKLEDAFQLFSDLSTLTKTNNKGRELINSLKATTEKLNHKTKGRRLLRTFCAIWKDPWMTINSDTFMNSILQELGCENVFGHHSDRYPEVNIDEIKLKQPDLVLLPDEPYNFTTNDVEKLQDVMSDKSIRYLLIPGSYLSWYSPRLINGLNLMFELIHHTVTSD